MAILNVDQEQANEPYAEVRDALQNVFMAALLLTGSAASAEFAILEGIRTLNACEGSRDALLLATLRAAVRPTAATSRDTFARPDVFTSNLPVELRRVLALPEDLRQSFVLRLLLGLPPDECSRLLSLKAAEVEKNMVSGALALAHRQEPAALIVEFFAY